MGGVDLDYFETRTQRAFRRRLGSGDGLGKNPNDRYSVRAYRFFMKSPVERPTNMSPNLPLSSMPSTTEEGLTSHGEMVTSGIARELISN